ncbi:MAG TPA: hypothetical protein VFN25_15875 [Dokdonella sp.]|nr:hypothetical protein [Dokdonella sp.]HET9034369.1 hypothetical protein [Dokdonella sp.]
MNRIRGLATFVAEGSNHIDPGFVIVDGTDAAQSAADAPAMH